jgi:hypothetical protein
MSPAGLIVVDPALLSADLPVDWIIVLEQEE